jgi:hypothetical protein
VGARQLRIEVGDLTLQILDLGVADRKLFVRFGQLAVLLEQLLVALIQRMRQEHLGDDEHHQDEDDDHEQRAEDVDITRPGIELAAASASGGDGGHDVGAP